MPYIPQGVVVEVRKLSDLIIDTNKNWLNYKIVNLGNAVTYLTPGDYTLTVPSGIKFALMFLQGAGGGGGGGGCAGSESKAGGVEEVEGQESSSSPSSLSALA